MLKKIAGIAIGFVVLSTLTACDPPMPDSLKVELAERTVICPETPEDVGTTESIVDAASFWNDSLNNACGLMFNMTESPSSGIEFSDHQEIKCKPFLTVPVALDAAVVTFVLGDNYELTFDAPTLGGILSGKITNWSDPAIVALNEYAILNDQEIVVSKTALGPARDALEGWIETETGMDLDLSYIQDSSELESDSIYSMIDGELRITAFSSTLMTGYPLANIAVIAGDIGSVVVPDAQLIQAAGTQVEVAPDSEAGTLEFVYNRDNPVQPLPGAVDPLVPYAPIYAVKMGLCGEDTVNLRNTARYFLRLDSQGVIQTGLTSPLPENIRVAAAALVDEGNPSIDLDLEVTE